MILDITPEQLREAAREVYEPGKYKHAPAQIFIDHAWGDVTYLRVSFPEKFTYACAGKLDALKAVLLGRHGCEADVVFCIYYDTIDAERMARHTIAISGR